MSREVLRAILKGDIEKFDGFIQQGIVVNEVTEKERWNYLHRALMSIAKPPVLEMVQHLIACGVDVNAIDVYGNNSLHYAMKLKDANIVRVLLDAKVDVNHVNDEGVSPLREALLTKPYDYSSIQLLLEHGADVEQKVEGGISVKEFSATVANEDATLMDLFNK
ncbi:ankyrin repeat domain-containing protein [Neptunomonas phycophila]|uniref:ankyrin repeat domain-containing protein n=1 Tax=Neptunomonas phycophila TaxID=1572645 RepID=UPI000948A78C|nr:ankyrin repeat domain-containing protein [Neptunomonas phycophila]QLE97116.1 ankyrin repeat domain-containing protein [Neptunomonas phycophila]